MEARLVGNKFLSKHFLSFFKIETQWAVTCLWKKYLLQQRGVQDLSRGNYAFLDLFLPWFFIRGFFYNLLFHLYKWTFFMVPKKHLDTYTHLLK